MSVAIPDSHKDLLEGPIYSILTTVSPEGQPENTVIWCSYDGSHILVNTARGRRKERNVQANKNVALTAIDPQNPYRWIDVRGVVEEVTEEGALDNINTHAKLYAGKDRYYGGVQPEDLQQKETRVLLKIKPQRVVAFAPPG